MDFGSESLKMDFFLAKSNANGTRSHIENCEVAKFVFEKILSSLPKFHLVIFGLSSMDFNVLTHARAKTL